MLIILIPRSNLISSRTLFTKIPKNHKTTYYWAGLKFNFINRFKPKSRSYDMIQGSPHKIRGLIEIKLSYSRSSSFSLAFRPPAVMADHVSLDESWVCLHATVPWKSERCLILTGNAMSVSIRNMKPLCPIKLLG